MGRLTRTSAAEKLELIRIVEESSLPVKQTLAELDIPRSTFYRWYARYLDVGYEGLEDRSPQPRQFWNRIPDSVRQQVVQMALDHPELSPRELACHITDTEAYFISESSVYRILKAFDLITSPAFILLKAADKFAHPTTRVNEQTSTGRHVPVINIDFSEEESLVIEMIPKGSGSENNSWLRMAIPAEGVDAIKTFVIDCVLEAGGKTCPPTIVGVGVGGTADLCLHLAKEAATRPLGSHCADPEGAKLERELAQAVNMLGVGPQGLGGDSTAFAVHVETAATHITMNPIAVNMQCHSARRARATFTPSGVAYGF